MTFRTYTVILFFTFLTTNFYSNITTEKNEVTEVVFTTEISEDATPSVLAKILENKALTSIKFEKGTYHFYPDKGFEKFVFLSNHGDLLTTTPFPLDDFKNLTIDGQGSSFIFHGVMLPFLIENSANITVKNVTIDWSEAFHSEGLIVANNKEENSFDMQISDEYPYEIRNEQIYFIKPYYEHELGQSILYDTKRKGIAFNTEAATQITSKGKIPKTNRNHTDKITYKYAYDKRAPEYKNLGAEYIIKVKQLKPGLVRVFGHRKELPPVGEILTMKGAQGFNRVSPAFSVKHTTGFKGTNVTIHHAGGMGIIAENSSDLILDNFNVTPSKGRMVSTTADATHFVGCRGKVVLKNSKFTNQLDDALNVHGTYQSIVDILSENSIGVRMEHHQQLGFKIGNKKDTLGFVRLSNSFFAYDKATIKNIQYINQRYQIITLNEELPKDLKIGDLIENLDAYPDVLVQNCIISNNRARGLLISNPKKTVIENNFFSTEMEAILIPVESGHWFESGNAANVIIRNNIFQDNQHSGFNRGVIRFATDDDNKNIAFRNIEISNNTFNQFDNLILEITNTDGLLFKENTITNSGTFPQLHPQNAAIHINASQNIKFEKNTYSGKATEMIKSDKNVPTIQFQ
ncbi:right-handed parallel beta-helix repeat-containing protein [Aquimarina sp. ERC-38]|uniref:right-handed parallel beta-helix repeat-containing protein n=1 Tax=Aquimarina sp. ERC-38 TaxID=2949996 RepID=UPI00224875CB|nr:right-handed parallel beta-helix repeat-containing protein [Aquimarina sp. ERC-38]UZO82216.1 right-handed parallel beta-helix repeat-containing protein [Aquimarina sp. ERC-38]